MNGRENLCSKMCVSEIKPNEPTRDYIRYSNYYSHDDQHNTTTTHATTSELLPRDSATVRYASAHEMSCHHERTATPRESATTVR